MKIQTGETYSGEADTANLLAASDAKVGKTFFLVYGILGLLPWQKRGGIVDRPSHLHVVTTDTNALGRIQKAMKLMVGNTNPEALKFNVYNMEDDYNKIHVSDKAWDMTFYNTLCEVHEKIIERVTKSKGIHAVLLSSLTGLGGALLRGIQGPPGQYTESGAVKKGSGMDQSKWSAFAAQVTDIRAKFQLDLWHCIWEAHLYKPAKTGQSRDEESDTRKETLQLPGSSGANFAFNVGQVFRIRRNFGKRYPGTNVDEVYFDTAPSLDFITGGRNVTECLKPQEYDPTVAFEKLGLKVGYWGRKKAK